ncbi:MAG: DUF4221 domain-containing protein [Tannerellaceae bacterium]|jgi:hypothetical protein|nr:DUF4221 domain-containing protein [Tannerellaceae bacterium]
MKKYMSLLLFACLLACHSNNRKVAYDYNLVETDRHISFELDNETMYNFHYAWLFTGDDGRDYFSFLNYRSNQILFYDFNTQAFLFKIEMPREGPDGVFPIMGYYAGGFDRMYIATMSRAGSGLLQIDTTAHIVKKILYGITPEGYEVNDSFWPSSSQPHNTPVFIGNKLYITQRPYDSRTPGIVRPVSVAVDTANHTAEQFPFTFNDVLTAAHTEKSAGGKTNFSRAFDGRRFIYSFYGLEAIFAASIDHQTIEKREAKSRYIDQLTFEANIQDPEAGTRREAEIAAYGDLIYDPYREVYYRFAYPETTLDPSKSYFRKSVFGRKKFSVIILDKNLNIIGETLFPEAIFNSYVYFVHKDGLYISRDYQIGEDQTEDRLNYTCFELKKGGVPSHI